MWITILETRKEGIETFTRGEVRYVTHAFGSAAIAAGWAGLSDDMTLYLVSPPPVDGSPVTLHIDSGSIGFADTLRSN
jgi:hypothetical protein